ncbi:hypothetical protein JCM10212_000032 [Sporobolomyces blumeae]
MSLLQRFADLTPTAIKAAFVAFVILNLSVRFLLPWFLPFSGSIGHVSLSALHNIRVDWRGIEVEIKALGVSATRGGKAWSAVYSEKTRILVRKESLLHALPFRHSPPAEQPKPHSPKHPAERDPHRAPPPPPPASLLRRLFLPFLIRRLITLVAIVCDFELEFEGIGVISGTVRWGGAYERPHLRVPVVGLPKNEDTLSFSLRVEDIVIREWIGSAHDRAAQNGDLGSGLAALELTDAVTFKLSGPVGRAEWKSLKPRERSIKASVEVEETGSTAKLGGSGHARKRGGLIVRVHEVKRLIAKVEDLRCEAKRRQATDRPLEKESTRPEPSEPKDRPSPLVYFDTFAVAFPTTTFSLHYTTPDSVRHYSPTSSASPSARRPPPDTLPQTIAFALIVRGIKGKLKLKGKTGAGTCVRESHMAFLGNARDCEVVGSIGWEEVEGRIDVDGTKEQIPDSTTKTLSIGPSEIALTSTWLPLGRASSTPSREISRHSQKPRASLPAPQNYNDPLVVLEVSVGEVRGQTTFETLDAALRIFKARPRPPRRNHAPRQSKPASDKPKHTLFENVPKFVSSLTIASLEFRIVAPDRDGLSAHRAHPVPSDAEFYRRGEGKFPAYEGHHPYGRPPRESAQADASSTSSASRDGATDRDPHESFFTAWNAPELVCVEVPRVSVTSRGEWQDRGVVRKASDRLKAKRLERISNAESARESVKAERERLERSREGRTRTLSNESSTQDAEADESDRKEASREAELRGRKRSEERSKSRKVSLPNLTTQLDTYSHEYTVSSLVNVDTISIQILALEDVANDGSSSDGGGTDSAPELIRLEVASVGPIELSSRVSALGYDAIDEDRNCYAVQLDADTCQGDHSFLVQQLRVQLWRPLVLTCIRDVLSSFASAAATSTRRERTTSAASSCCGDSPALSPEDRPLPKPLVDVLPANHSLYFAVASTHLRLGGVDPKPEVRACRGVEIRSGTLYAEYVLKSKYEPERVTNDVNRSKLQLRPDFLSDANAMASAGGRGGKDDARQALLNFSVADMVVDPLVEATDQERGEQSQRGKAAARRKFRTNENGEQVRRKPKLDHELVGRAHIDERASTKSRSSKPKKSKAYELSESIVSVPLVELSVRIHKAAHNEQAMDPGVSLDEIVVRLDVATVKLRLELFSIYLCLLTVSSLRWLRPTRPPSGTSGSEQPPGPARRPRPLVSFTTSIRAVHVFPSLPHEVVLFLNLRSVVIRFQDRSGLEVKWENGVLAGKSRIFRGKWEDMVRLQASSVMVRERPNDGHQPFVVAFNSDSARIRIPYRYVFSQVVDNLVSLVKATKQLVHEHVKGRWDCIIEPTNEGPKRLPEINVSVGTFAIEFQDDPLESKLNMIWKVGLVAQQARTAREKAFEAKAEAIRKAEEKIANPSLETDSRASSDNDKGDEHADANSATPKVNGEHTISIREAREALDAYNATDWIKRMGNAQGEQRRREQALAKKLYGPKYLSSFRDLDLPIDILPVGTAAPLGRATFDSLRLSVTKASFGDDGLPDFLHDVGKGLPRDTRFSLLVPIHLSWRFDQARFTIRDYPLPLLHIPRNHHDGEPAWDWQTDLVVGEELGPREAVRRVNCSVIPPRHYAGGRKGWSMTVPRSAMTVKTYMAPKVRISSGQPTRIGWGNSVQPAVHDIARAFESMTKNSPDPSDRIGFWDKVRLQFHWRLAIDFVGDKASVVFHLKGSRDPHSLSEYGAGFAKSWTGNVKWRIGYDNPDYEFFQITSNSYVLGIPNLREYFDSASAGAATQASNSPDNASVRSGETDFDDAMSDDMSAYDVPELEKAYWIKICAKCVGGVRWGMGLRCERTCRDDECTEAGCRGRPTFERQCRFFDFIPHWEVKTKTRRTAERKPDGSLVDSFAGFRSDHIHFSISLTSPATLTLPHEDSADAREAAENDPSHQVVGSHGHNSFHFTPQAIAHFRRWWSLFDGTMSLPIRQGRMFPSTGQKSKKFGKHCATIKYRFSLSPLYISHTYAQENWAEWKRGVTSAVGLKAKIGRCNVDLHQREQETVTKRTGEMEPKIVRHKAFYQAEIDLDSVDLRVIEALFSEPEKASVSIPEDDEAEAEDDVGHAPSTKYGVLPEDTEWIDLNDFNDSGHVFQDKRPDLRVIPFLASPRFVLYRYVQANSSAKDEKSRSPTDHPTRPTTKFGHEPSHICLMRRSTDTVLIQAREAKVRLAELVSQLSAATESAGRANLEARIRTIKQHLRRLRDFQKEGDPKVFDACPDSVGDDDGEDGEYTEPDGFTTGEFDDAHLRDVSDILYREWQDWTNRFVVHNPKIQISNGVRELLLKYYFSSRDRKGFVYHVSAAVVKFIRDLDNQDTGSRGRGGAHQRSKSASRTKKDYDDAEDAKNRLLHDLANGRADPTAHETLHSRIDGGDRPDLDPTNSTDGLPDDFESNPRHLCLFIAPQISLHSDTDPKSTIIFNAIRVTFKTFQIVDTRVPDDPVNYEVLNQTYATLSGLQAYYPTKVPPPTTLGDGETVFLPLEVQLRPRLDEDAFERVVEPTSARLRYDKVNQLRIRSQGGSDSAAWSGFNSHTDRISVEGDKFSVRATSDVYVAAFNVIFRLLLIPIPQRKIRNTKVTALAYTHDFSDRASVIRSVEERQNEIRDLIPEILAYQPHLDELAPEDRKRLFSRRARLAHLSEEVALFVDGLRLAQQTYGTKKANNRTGLHLQGCASELNWTMLHADKAPLVKLAVVNIDFTWLSKNDGSATNRLIIGNLVALNPGVEAIFAEMIEKLFLPDTEPGFAQSKLFAAAIWDSNAAVGGISVIERFELYLHPVALRLEHKIGRQILDYLFAERVKSNKEDKSVEGDRNRLSPEKAKQRNGSNYSLPNRSVESLAASTRRSSEQQSSPTGSSQSLVPSNASVHSVESRMRKAASHEVLASISHEEGLDADEMQRRARLFRAFLSVLIPSTQLRLTYHSEESDHSLIPDVYNITYKTPTIQFASKTTSFAGLVDDIKAEMIKSLWNQKGSLVGQFLNRAHRRLPLPEQRAAVTQKVKSKLRNPLGRRIKNSLHLHGADSASSELTSPQNGTSPLRLITSSSSSSSTASSSIEAVSIVFEDESRPRRHDSFARLPSAESAVPRLSDDQKRKALLGGAGAL